MTVTAEIITERGNRRRHRHTLVIGGVVVGRADRSLKRTLWRLRHAIARLRAEGIRIASVTRTEA